jgi:hypothetical protein
MRRNGLHCACEFYTYPHAARATPQWIAWRLRVLHTPTRLQGHATMDCMALASFTHTHTPSTTPPRLTEIGCMALASFTHTRTPPAPPHRDLLRKYSRLGSVHERVKRLLISANRSSGSWFRADWHQTARTGNQRSQLTPKGVIAGVFVLLFCGPTRVISASAARRGWRPWTSHDHKQPASPRGSEGAGRAAPPRRIHRRR